MEKLKVSIALAIAVAGFAANASAQTPAARNDASSVVTDAGLQQPSNGQQGSPKPVAQDATTQSAQNNNALPGGVANEAAAANPATVPLERDSAASPAALNAYAPAPVGAVAIGPAGTVEPLPGDAMPVAADESRPAESTEPTRTYDHRFTGSLDVANVLWRSGSGYRLFADNDRAWRIALGFGYDLVRLPEHLVVAIEAGYVAEPGHSAEPSVLGGDLKGSLSASTLLLGGSLRWAATPWLAPYGRVGVLASRVAMDFHSQGVSSQNSDSVGVSWSQHKWTEGALLGAGVMLNMLPHTRVNFGLLAEGGVWLQRSVDMRLNRELPAGAISTSGAGIGTLENTGPYLRIAGVLRF